MLTKSKFNSTKDLNNLDDSNDDTLMTDNLDNSIQNYSIKSPDNNINRSNEILTSKEFDNINFVMNSNNYPNSFSKYDD